MMAKTKQKPKPFPLRTAIQHSLLRTSRVRVFEGAVEAALFDPASWQRQTLAVGPNKSFELDPRIGRVSETAAPPATLWAVRVAA